MSLSYDGVNDEVYNQAISGIDTTTMSVSFWINCTTGGGTPLITASARTAGNSAIQMIFTADPKIVFRYRWSTSTNGVAQWSTATGSVALGRWHHIGVSYDRGSTSNDPIIYIDGVLAGLTEDTAPSGTAKASVAVISTGENAAGLEDFTGFIAHVEFFAGLLLSQGQFQQIMRYPGSVNTRMRRVYWPFQSTSTLQPDYSGYGFSATVEGAIKSTIDPPINGIFNIPTPQLMGVS